MSTWFSLEMGDGAEALFSFFLTAHLVASSRGNALFNTTVPAGNPSTWPLSYRRQVCSPLRSSKSSSSGGVVVQPSAPADVPLAALAARG